MSPAPIPPGDAQGLHAHGDGGPCRFCTDHRKPVEDQDAPDAVALELCGDHLRQVAFAAPPLTEGVERCGHCGDVIEDADAAALFSLLAWLPETLEIYVHGGCLDRLTKGGDG